MMENKLEIIKLKLDKAILQVEHAKTISFWRGAFLGFAISWITRIVFDLLGAYK